MNREVDSFIAKAPKWGREMAYLRDIVLSSGLNEVLKWKQPCYEYKSQNIVIIGALKNYCVLGFFKGVLLSDGEGLLTSPGENSRHVKQFKFSNLQSIELLEEVIKQCIFEAIEIEKAGLKVLPPTPKNNYCIELEEELANNKAFNTAFNQLTPGRQRAYNLFFSGAKQSATRVKRIEKYTERILQGYGINDCTCGHTKRKPTCDGSHKYL